MIEQVIPSRRRDLGGFEVGRLLPAGRRRMVGPFIFFDHIGPVDLQPPLPRAMDVRPHPHIGLATITYLFDGELTHRDSLGFTQVIRPAEVNWMTAGSGIAHSERFEGMRAHGGAMHGIQAWVALPDEDEEVDPAFEHHPHHTLPLVEEQGMRARVIAGSVFGRQSPVVTRSPTIYAHIEIAPGGRCEIPLIAPERALFIANGRVEIAGEQYEAGQMLVLGHLAQPIVAAKIASTVMLLGGEPLGPRYIWWNFVSSRRERIEQAQDDWRTGRFRLPVGDTEEFVPLPNDPLPEPHPLS